MTALLDSSVLIAATIVEHVHHARASMWVATTSAFATCPSTQGSLLRALVRQGTAAPLQRALLRALDEDERHEFWPDSLHYLAVDLDHVRGHRQVTDAYLAALARSRSGQVATLDRGFAAAHPDVAELIPA